ncbi:MAG: acyltransferase family protein, partial [Angustibacter sp.]
MQVPSAYPTSHLPAPDRLSVTQVIPPVILPEDPPAHEPRLSAMGERTARLRQKSRAPRLSWVDQVRWSAVALVVIGHFLGGLRGRSAIATTVSDFIYLFHMPVLVILAGWAARDARPGAPALTKMAWGMLAPFAIFQVLLLSLTAWQGGQDMDLRFTTPTYGLWFLVTLVGWRILQPWFNGFRWPVLIALGIALLIGASPNFDGFLSLARLFFFLPFFLAGPWLVENFSRWRENSYARVGSGVILALAFCAIVSRYPDFDRTIFLGRNGYSDLGQGTLEGTGQRCLAWAVSLILAASFCLAIPGRTGCPSPIGKKVASAGAQTMYPYLLHLPIVLLLRPLLSHGPSEVVAVAMILLGLGGCILLSSRPVRRITVALVEPVHILRWGQRTAG